MAAAKTPSERQQEFRRRNQEAGLVPVTVYVRPEHRAKVRELEAWLREAERRFNEYSPDFQALCLNASASPK